MLKEGEKLISIPKKQKKSSDLPDKESDWVDYVNQLHDRGLQDRKRQELQWVINLSYYQGLQNIFFNRKTGLIHIGEENEAPLVINRVGAFVEARLAKLTKNKPTPRVIPDSSDLEDLRGAEVSDKALMHLWRKIQMEEKYDTLIMRQIIFGNSFLETLWNPLTGDRIDGSLLTKPKMSKQNEFLMDEEGTLEEEEIFLGEISSEPVSPFQLIPAHSNVNSIRDQPWLIKRSLLTKEDASRIYPHLREDLDVEQEESIRTQYEKMLDELSSQFMGERQASSHGLKEDSVNKMILAKTMWLKPNAVFPDGVVITVIGDKLARISEFPNDYGKNVYPIVRFTEKNDGVHFWQQATIERLIPIQRSYNQLRNQKLNNARKMANIKWGLPFGSGVGEDSLTDEEAEIVQYNSTVGAPKPLEVMPLPNYVSELARELIVDFRDCAGQRETTTSPAPNLTAGVAMQ